MQIAASGFPAVDPIPLPAPVWIFKGLHAVTLTLHFGALFLLLGGLVVAVVWNFLGHARRHHPMISASGVVAHRLPVVMTYVINLGVPPLLFAQVLYGRALYTSSVMIGGIWLSVIFVAILAYALIYRSSRRAWSCRPWWFGGAVALAATLAVSMIYTTNMTLMLRPEVWPGMYQRSALGWRLPPHDPTLLPRWLLMLSSALGFGALGTMGFSFKSGLDFGVREFLNRWGGRLALVGLAAAALAGIWAFSAQPQPVREALLNSKPHGVAMVLWGAGLVLAWGVAVSGARQPDSFTSRRAGLGLVGALVSIGALVAVRDGVRDRTLALHGLDVWDRVVVPNWVVLGVFLGVFVMGIGFLIWLGLQFKRARPVEETYVST